MGTPLFLRKIVVLGIRTLGSKKQQNFYLIWKKVLLALRFYLSSNQVLIDHWCLLLVSFSVFLNLISCLQLSWKTLIWQKIDFWPLLIQQHWINITALYIQQVLLPSKRHFSYFLKFYSYSQHKFTNQQSVVIFMGITWFFVVIISCFPHLFTACSPYLSQLQV